MIFVITQETHTVQSTVLFEMKKFVLEQDSYTLQTYRAQPYYIDLSPKCRKNFQKFFATPKIGRKNQSGVSNFAAFF